MKPDPKIKLLLERGFERYNRPNFIVNDPISLPHRFQKKEDIEIIGFLVSIIAWGQRKSIINSGLKMIELMHHAPYDFILHHTENDLKKCSKFVHRTFNGDDFLSIIGFIQSLYLDHGGLETAFSKHLKRKDTDVGPAISGFRKSYENSPYYIDRTKKHIATPDKGSACKRINMFLRWMVRKDDNGVDFGLWKTIRMDQLICPLDVHVLNQAKSIKLIDTDKGDWKTAIELTNKLKMYDPKDPVKYDFSLFGSGVEKTGIEKMMNNLNEVQK